MGHSVTSEHCWKRPVSRKKQKEHSKTAGFLVPVVSAASRPVPSTRAHGLSCVQPSESCPSARSLSRPRIGSWAQAVTSGGRAWGPSVLRMHPHTPQVIRVVCGPRGSCSFQGTHTHPLDYSGCTTASKHGAGSRIDQGSGNQTVSFGIEPRAVREDAALKAPSRQPRPRCGCEQGARPRLACCSRCLLPGKKATPGSVCAPWDRSPRAFGDL